MRRRHDKNSLVRLGGDDSMILCRRDPPGCGCADRLGGSGQGRPRLRELELEEIDWATQSQRRTHDSGVFAKAGEGSSMPNAHGQLQIAMSQVGQ